MNPTENEKRLAGKLKERGLTWRPREGDWFWSPQDFSHTFYLGESLPSSYAFRQGEAYVFDASMIWHVQQGGLDPNRFVWLPTWEQCRSVIRENGYSIGLREKDGSIFLEATRGEEALSASGATDLETMYGLMLETLKPG